MAAPGVQGGCPSCGERVTPKCGEVKMWHFAHERDFSCDPWAEGETQWHLCWKLRFPAQCVEVPMGGHRADVRTPMGVVLEFQHSSLSPELIRKREEHYGRMAWVIDASTFCRNVEFFERSGFIDMPTVQFRWKWRSETWKNASSPLFLDFSDGLPHNAVTNEPRLLFVEYVGENQFGRGIIVPVETFIAHFSEECPSRKLLERHGEQVIVADVFSEFCVEERLRQWDRIEENKILKPWFHPCER